MADKSKLKGKGGNAKPRVIVYSTMVCPYCVMVKDYLRAKGVDYEDVNLTEHRERIDEVVIKSGQTGVPVVDINGRIIIGFDRGAIDAALAGN